MIDTEHRNSPLLIRLTPPGRGAVASLRIEGPSGVEVTGGVVLRPPAVGRYSAAADRRRASWRRGSRPSAGIPRRRLNCIATAGWPPSPDWKSLLVGRGCRKVAGKNGLRGKEADPIAAAARLALADARTMRTAAILLDQYNGACARHSSKSKSRVQAGKAPAARRQAEALLAHAATGLHLVKPWQVVIAGRPNVGKSSLINAIAGYQRAIVHSPPGTTRDIVTVQTAMDGWPVEISDTAGLRESDDPIERAGIELAREKITAADLSRTGFRRLVAVDRGRSGAHGVVSGRFVAGQQERPAAGIGTSSGDDGRQRGDSDRRG